MRRIAALSILAAAGLAPGCSTVIREAKQGFFFIGSELSRTEVRIELDRSFIQRYKDRATIDLDFAVDRAGRHAHPSYLDGDLHVAGRASEIGLPIVAEVENAKLEKDAVDAVHRAAESEQTVRLTGAWRIWSEHFGKGKETQGEELDPIERTNPPHVFEVHPVTRIGDLDVSETFIPVPGFRPEPASVLFGSLRSAKCRIVPGDRTITIFTRRREYNDAEFVMELGREPQRPVSDGRFVRAAVVTPRGDRLADGIRMVFVKDTPPERIVKNLPAGSRLHVFGIPRVNLSEIAARADSASADPRALKGLLPYEIVVIGVFPATP